MNVQSRRPGAGDRPVGYALSGAAGGFARTLLAQTRLIPALTPAVLCDVDVPRLHELCLELGYAPEELHTCTDAEQTAAATAAGHIALVADQDLLGAGQWDVLVEATGSPAHGHAMARAALTSGRHVAMVSKEVDSVAGLQLARLAADHDVVYAPAEGDQPGNLIRLLDWARLLGMDVVAIGKSSEYDLVYDPATETVTQLDRTVSAPALGDLLTLGDDVRGTLAARAEAVAALPTGATADYCEMAVVANNTGYRPDVERLHYPVARIAELADIYSLREHGGLLHETGAVDVFSALRLPDEASFAGGEFVVLRTNDAETWRILAEKGHVVSRDGRYATVYLPYHLMGVETPATLLAIAAHGRTPDASPPGRHAVLAGRARADLAAGTVLDMGGHHHDVTGVQAVLLRDEDAPADVAPLYLAAHAALGRDVAAGGLITLSDLENPDSALVEAWELGGEWAREVAR
ncbi:homoserine dehydrogenase [Saccharopolyspora gloriosae]|uniref:homoserine dehydrogenase n=1 Tax=Saccharopolyspora gloriosae TaxID=455344 RepID=UPI001FB76411|nr:homoserine dehydrogenase [Saccharopolyspora gloriosae]